MLLTITTTAGNSHLVSLLFELFPTGFLIGVIYSKIQDIHSLKYYMCSECKYNEYQRFVQAFTNLFITIFPLNSLGITADIHFILSSFLLRERLRDTVQDDRENHDTQSRLESFRDIVLLNALVNDASQSSCTHHRGDHHHGQSQ